MDISQAIERREKLEKRLNALIDRLPTLGKGGLEIEARFLMRSPAGYEGDISDIRVTKEQAEFFILAEVEEIKTELAKMQPIFDVANQALKTVFPEQ